MKFKDCKFNGKKEVRKEVKGEIVSFLKREIRWECFNEGLIFQYIDLLLDETEYDIKGNRFYYKIRYGKITLSVKLLRNVALEYIKEHVSALLLEKYLP